MAESESARGVAAGLEVALGLEEDGILLRFYLAADCKEAAVFLKKHGPAFRRALSRGNFRRGSRGEIWEAVRKGPGKKGYLRGWDEFRGSLCLLIE
jgi:hypothetical protein